jgi:hypothetical protein
MHWMLLAIQVAKTLQRVAEQIRVDVKGGCWGGRWQLQKKWSLCSASPARCGLSSAPTASSRASVQAALPHDGDADGIVTPDALQLCYTPIDISKLGFEASEIDVPQLKVLTRGIHGTIKQPHVMPEHTAAVHGAHCLPIMGPLIVGPESEQTKNQRCRDS